MYEVTDQLKEASFLTFMEGRKTPDAAAVRDTKGASYDKSDLSTWVSLIVDLYTPNDVQNPDMIAKIRAVAKEWSHYKGRYMPAGESR